MECEPVYGGAGYLEKQDFIIENQKKRIAEKQAVLDEITMRVLDMENFVEQIINQLAKEFSIRPQQVEDTINLIDGGNTIPFIARYRKEVTGNLSDVLLRDLDVRLTYLRKLEKEYSKWHHFITILN